MKVTQVAIRPTEASERAGRPALTPELLAASGARYSRNNEGLEAILSKIDPTNLDKSVDSIFKMIDYGHQSIADMVPVAMFIDGISIWLAYYVWSLCPTAGGQESSTRYIKISPDALIAPSELGIPDDQRTDWQGLMMSSLEAYQSALDYWEGIAAETPELARIPAHLLGSSQDRDRKAAARMSRNYGFDRARYFLPVAASTNVMLIMSARGWSTLCQYLLSYPLPEAQRLGNSIAVELQLAAPRMLRHATAKDSAVKGIAAEITANGRRARLTSLPLASDSAQFDCPPTPHLDVMLPDGVDGDEFISDLSAHDTRYSWVGDNLRRTSVRFGWDAVAFAEIRDLNRHRTGSKHCPLVPVGFYYATDEIPASAAVADSESLRNLGEIGRSTTERSRIGLAIGDPTYVYWALLGSQFPFEHTTTADKFIYEAELRTGTGAHYRYARHLHDALDLWYDRFPSTRGLVLEGSAEPE